jgi:hypothetical protein
MNRSDALVMLVVAAVLTGCIGLNPKPPVNGMAWIRSDLSAGARRRTTDRVEVSGVRNLRSPLLLHGKDFRYRLDLEARAAEQTWSLTCAQTATRDFQGAIEILGVRADLFEYQCTEPSKSDNFEISFRNSCREGVLTVRGRPGLITPWKVGDVVVGFLVSFDGRVRAAIDVDDWWTVPVWVDADLESEAKLGVDLLAYVVNDMLDAESSGGFPFLCGSFSSALRSPR